MSSGDVRQFRAYVAASDVGLSCSNCAQLVVSLPTQEPSGNARARKREQVLQEDNSDPDSESDSDAESGAGSDGNADSDADSDLATEDFQLDEDTDAGTHERVNTVTVPLSQIPTAVLKEERGAVIISNVVLPARGELVARGGVPQLVQELDTALVSL